MDQSLKEEIERDIYMSGNGDKMQYVFFKSKLKPDKPGIFLLFLIRELFLAFVCLFFK